MEKLVEDKIEIFFEYHEVDDVIEQLETAKADALARGAEYDSISVRIIKSDDVFEDSELYVTFRRPETETERQARVSAQMRAKQAKLFAITAKEDAEKAEFARLKKKYEGG